MPRISRFLQAVDEELPFSYDKTKELQGLPMVLIKIESLSQKELEHIALQEGVQNVSSLSRDELIETLKDIYEDEREDFYEGGEDNIQRRFVTWLTDYRGDGSEVTSLPGVEELPELYPETSIHVLSKSATWLFCYWSIAPLDAERLSQELGNYDVLLHVTVSEDGQEVDSYDISVGENDYQWNINVSSTRGTAKVDLVVENAEGRREVLALSESVQLVSCYWLEHADQIRSDADLLEREFSLLTNREGTVLPCETVEAIVRRIEQEETV